MITVSYLPRVEQFSLIIPEVDLYLFVDCETFVDSELCRYVGMYVG